MDDWNDLRLVLAIARAGSLTRAAEILRVNHSTAFRRLTQLEARLGVRLFERLPGGSYLATGAGERMATAAERVETETAALDRDIAGLDLRLTGRLRVTSSETLAYSLLTRGIARFHAAHPGITVELAADNRVLSLSRREADLALRIRRPVEGDLYGRRVADVSWAVYAAPALAAADWARGAEAVSRLPFIAWEEGVRGINSADWISETIAPERIVYRTNSVVNQLVAARAGLGAAVLPCYLGDPEPDLVRVLDPLPELTRELWMVTHSDLRRTARIRAFFDIVGEFLVANRPLLGGTAGARQLLDRQAASVGNALPDTEEKAPA